MDAIVEGKRGITHAGDKVEDRVMKITGASEPDSRRNGDFVFERINGEAKDDKGGTINQYRACKFIPTIIWHEEKEMEKKKWDEGRATGRVKRKPTGWYVLPAHLGVMLVRDRRGQHQPNPFLCATLNVSQMDIDPCTDEQLTQKLRDAIEEDKRFPELKEAMGKIAKEAEDMAVRHKEMVRVILEEKIV